MRYSAVASFNTLMSVLPRKGSWAISALIGVMSWGNGSCKRRTFLPLLAQLVGAGDDLVGVGLTVILTELHFPFD